MVMIQKRIVIIVRIWNKKYPYHFPLILKENEVLSVDNVKKLYTLLNSDISDQFEDSPLEIIRLAAQKCHIGQAVNVKYGTDIECF
jgi:hypothetical protein